MSELGKDEDARKDAAEWDHSTHDEFFEYYADQSRRSENIARLVAMRDLVLKGLARDDDPIDVADLGCGAGTQSFVWAELGHRLHGLDVSERFIALGKERAARAKLDVDFRVGSVTDLPWPDASMDICLAIELLEHVPDWRRCLDEFTRVLRRGGAVFITTTNALCPKQQEFDLPLYSWYPPRLKRRYEELARTTRPELASYATYPAVNWFTPYGLRRELGQRGCECLDRFDLIDGTKKGAVKRFALAVIRMLPPARLLAHMATPSSWILGVKR
jgi:2-polyprenyl-3-methyl-5-hydroxy-6-metoxy-1,4-benzoquinol methylase